MTGELKLGNLRLSFTDLEIPVAGIPISVTRTYDTLTANSQDDFGYGWRLEFRDTDLRTNVKAPTEQQQLLGITAAFDDNTRFYVTLPGGKRTSFTFNPYSDRLNSFLGSAGSEALWYHPAFKSEDGSDVTLSVDDVLLVKGTDGKYYDLGGAAYNPENARFCGTYTLTTKEGIEYKIDGQSGDLLTVTDTNGNVLTYSDSGIVSSTGQSVTFERNADGQIVAAVDPEGNKIQYEYDENGDLVSVTDREENTTKFEDHESRVHYLEEVIDPLGRSGVRTGNDNQIAIIDALGRRTESVYDEKGQLIETIYPDNTPENPDDNYRTINLYDQGGRQGATIDEAGRLTHYKYDAAGRLIETIYPQETDTLQQFIDAVAPGQTVETIDWTKIVYPEETPTYLNDNPRTITESDKNGQVLAELDELGNRTEYRYDDTGRLIETIYPDDTPSDLSDNPRSKSEYDAAGRQVKEINALNRVTELIYDELGRVVETRFADGTKIETIYDAVGRGVASIDQAGNKTEYEYDSLGRMTDFIRFLISLCLSLKGIWIDAQLLKFC